MASLVMRTWPHRHLCWRNSMRNLVFRVSFLIVANRYQRLLRKMTAVHKTSNGSLPPCTDAHATTHRHKDTQTYRRARACARVRIYTHTHTHSQERHPTLTHTYAYTRSSVWIQRDKVTWGRSKLLRENEREEKGNGDHEENVRQSEREESNKTLFKSVSVRK